jgi:hypothetical protein
MSVGLCEGCDRPMSVADQELARSRRADGLFCGSCRDGATIAELRAELQGAVSRDTLESDRFLDRVLDELEERNGQPLNLAEWDLKAAIRAALDRLGKAEDR